MVPLRRTLKKQSRAEISSLRLGRPRGHRREGSPHGRARPLPRTRRREAGAGRTVRRQGDPGRRRSVQGAQPAPGRAQRADRANDPLAWAGDPGRGVVGGPLRRARPRRRATGRAASQGAPTGGGSITALGRRARSLLPPRRWETESRPGSMGRGHPRQLRPTTTMRPIGGSKARSRCTVTDRWSCARRPTRRSR